MHDRDRNTHMHDRAMSLSVYRHFNKKLPGEEESEDTKGTTRIRKSKKDRQHNGQRKKDKRTNNYLQNIHIKLKVE